MSDQHTPDTPPKDAGAQPGEATQDKASTADGKDSAPGKPAQSAAAATLPAGPERPPMNPYLAGVFLGLTLLASYLILGAGLGASGALARFGAWAEHLLLPARVEANAYFGPWFPGPLSYYLVFMVVGVFAGGLFSALSGGRVRVGVERGPTASRMRRLILALLGGVLAGFASRLAMGCTSGQGLSGGAIFLTGSFVFMGCLFAMGYLSAWAFRRQWK
ncbi:MAG: YeeE/YedE thiosulfate transporter family protein [Acidobacteriota bacterium]